MSVGPLHSTLREFASDRDILEQSGNIIADGGSLVSPIVARGFAIWSGARRSQPMPMAADLKAEQLEPILPYVYLVDVVDEADRNRSNGEPNFRYRLVGTDVVSHTEADNTGRLLSEVAHQGSQSTLIRLYSLAIRTGEPAVQRIPYFSKEGTRNWYETIVLPMATQPGGKADRLLGVAEHFHQTIPSGPLQADHVQPDQVTP